MRFWWIVVFLVVVVVWFPIFTQGWVPKDASECFVDVINGKDTSDCGATETNPCQSVRGVCVMLNNFIYLVYILLMSIF